MNKTLEKTKSGAELRHDALELSTVPAGWEWTGRD